MSVLVCNRKFCEASVYSEILSLWGNIEKDISNIKSSSKYAISGISKEKIEYIETILNNDFRRFIEIVSIAKNVPVTKKTKEYLIQYKMQNIINALGFVDVIFADIEHMVFLDPKILHRIDHYKLIELGKIKDSIFTWKNNTLKKIDILKK